ncbi:phosphoribosylformylglycinamidine synthase subunit PurS [Stackebrandtia nassauensis]|uniref:Phosphoribosylformylglycinamidine synthase subunit PurS n=1 Tax=Stackebrandtia nassauensis (strain DSM 44728 / CIP 108903 / NRRL B-16338 / NBRC 102104 / LLR-40K-21) TaxID=446470 RepID=D3Q5G3_STANL|nr:phosphoribosylformylglycinamidine synthase subunit PurS [Stackebrandtia nassauensis]ADD46023.1 phosphoribosylformylglycinamidine synthase, purS [Stackebrandtia nassauensis DSM 44728]
MARVVVDVMLKPEILDPQGEAVVNALPRLGVAGVSGVRIGKRIELEFSDDLDEATVLERANEAADKLLANPVIETYTLRVETPHAVNAESA